MQVFSEIYDMKDSKAGFISGTGAGAGIFSDTYVPHEMLHIVHSSYTVEVAHSTVSSALRALESLANAQVDSYRVRLWRHAVKRDMYEASGSTVRPLHRNLSGARCLRERSCFGTGGPIQGVAGAIRCLSRGSRSAQTIYV